MKEAGENQSAEDRHRELCAAVDARPERAADAICEAVGQAVSEALVSGQFRAQLRSQGWALAYVGDHGKPPPAPAAWLQNAIELMDPGLHDPLEWAEALWRQAWEDGRRVGAAMALEAEDEDGSADEQ